MKKRMVAASGLSGCLVVLLLGMSDERRPGTAEKVVVTQVPSQPADSMYAFAQEPPDAPARPRGVRQRGGNDDADKPGARGPRGQRGDGGRPGDRGAPGTRGGAGPLLAALDTDSNGELSQTEIANAATSLKKLDKNNDGKITANELRAPEGRDGGGRGARGNLQERLARFDKNGDGKISKDEAPPRMQENWDRLDKNGDGTLDAAEMEQIGARRGGGDRSPRRGGRDNDDDDQP